MPKEYTTHRYPCLDIYPAGKEFITPSQYKQMAQQQLKKQGLRGKLSVGKESRKLRASFKVASIWKQPEIKIAFVDGSPKQKKWVMKMVQKDLEPIVNKLKFTWNVPVQQADIRISFALKGQAWSTVGTDAKLVPSPQPTMNFGWLDDDTQYGSEKFKNTGQVVLHEFGHALGMIHEHQNPKNNLIVWNKPVVIAELSRTQGWDIQTIEHNMFAKYGDKELCEEAKALPTTNQTRTKKIQDFCSGELVNGSDYDVNSIMHYFYPSEWIKEGPKKIPVNTTFSALDKKWLGKYYGKPKPKVEPKPPPTPKHTPTPKRTPKDEHEVEVDTQGYSIIVSVFIILMMLILLYVIFTTIYPKN